MTSQVLHVHVRFAASARNPEPLEIKKLATTLHRPEKGMHIPRSSNRPLGKEGGPWELGMLLGASRECYE